MRHAPRVGISACLLGREVRYDGGHKRDAFLTDVLGRLVEWVPVCPEVELGLGTPREPIRLVRIAGGLRMVTIHSGVDHTNAMNAWAQRRVEQLASADLCGYVLKKDSPSCGLEGVEVYGSGGIPERVGRGLFAAVLAGRFPDLPIEEEGGLSSPELRQRFIDRVFAYRRRKDAAGPRAARPRNV
jgi:uncharacterized protein YbbK (DUF523 family)